MFRQFLASYRINQSTCKPACKTNKLWHSSASQIHGSQTANGARYKTILSQH